MRIERGPPVFTVWGAEKDPAEVTGEEASLRWKESQESLASWKLCEKNYFKKIIWGAWLSRSVDCATPDLGVMCLSPMLGVEMT